MVAVLLQVYVLVTQTTLDQVVRLQVALVLAVEIVTYVVDKVHVVHTMYVAAIFATLVINAKPMLVHNLR